MTKEKKFPSQVADRFQIRMPDGLRTRIAETSEKTGIPMNTLIVEALENSFPEPKDIRRDLLKHKIEEAKATVQYQIQKLSALEDEWRTLTGEEDAGS